MGERPKPAPARTGWGVVFLGGSALGLGTAAKMKALKKFLKVLSTFMKSFMLPLFAVGAFQAGQREDWGKLFECVASAAMVAYSASSIDGDFERNHC